MTTAPQPEAVETKTGPATGDPLEALTRSAWQAATAAAEPLSLILVELDDFARYGDNYGAEAGELLLRRTGAVIRGSVRANDHVGRVDVAGFVIILPGATLDTAQIPAERILRAVRDLEIPHRGSTISNYATVSLGAASCRPQTGDSMATLIDAATSALWTAKRSGHNRIAAYELSANVSAEESLRAIG